MKSLWIVVSIYNNETTSGLVVFRTEPVLDKIKNLTSNIQPLASELRRNSQSTNQDCREVETSFGIRNTTLKTIFGGLGYMLRFDTIIS